MNASRAQAGSELAGLLVLEHVSAVYGPYRALFDVSFTVPAGSAVALVGSNGAGKSTVARVVSGLVKASGGRVLFAGRDITRWPAWRVARAGLSHAPEGRSVFATLSVEENLVLTFRQAVGRRGVADALERAYQAFPRLQERHKQLAGTLSGGEQRMLSLAKVLAVPQKLLVVDELSLGLAPVVVDEVFGALQAIRANGTALLVVEQHMDRVLALADRVVVLSKGRVVYSGSPEGAAALATTLVPPAGDDGTSRGGPGADAGDVGELGSSGLGEVSSPSV